MRTVAIGPSESEKKERGGTVPTHPPRGQSTRTGTGAGDSHSVNCPNKKNWKRRKRSPGTLTAILPDPAWGKFPSESTAHYLKFTDYRNLPAGKRSVAAVARKYEIREDALRDVAKGYRWKERAECWDVHLALLRDDLSEAAVLGMRQNQARLGRAAQNLALGAILLKDPSKVGPVTALKLARDGVDIEREALGLPVGKQPVIVQQPSQSVQIGLALPQGDGAADHPFKPAWFSPSKVVEALPESTASPSVGAHPLKAAGPVVSLKDKVEAASS